MGSFLMGSKYIALLNGYFDYSVPLRWNLPLFRCPPGYQTCCGVSSADCAILQSKSMI